jgi:hypothetical protein
MLSLCAHRSRTAAPFRWRQSAKPESRLLLPTTIPAGRAALQASAHVIGFVRVVVGVDREAHPLKWRLKNKFARRFSFVRSIVREDYRNRNHSIISMAYGGRGGIRTHGTLAGTPVFKTGALNHSATLPDREIA